MWGGERVEGRNKMPSSEQIPSPPPPPLTPHTFCSSKELN